MTAIGCYSHYPASVYGPNGYPGTYAVPPGSGYPQGSYTLPQNAPLQGSGASLGPDGTYGSQSPSANGSTNRWKSTGAGGDAPAFGAATSGVAPGGNDTPVPNHKYANDLDAASAEGFGGTSDFGDTNDFGSEASESPAPNDTENPMTPFGSEEAEKSPFGDAAAASFDESVRLVEDASFVTPKTQLTPVASIRNIADSSEVAVAASVPYKYDRENFQWLRGVVDYDSEAGSWNIIYNIEPDQQDQFGGSIVLAGAAADQFETLQNNDVILVEGEVDTKRLDAFGKPMFRVARLDRLEPVN